MRKFLLCTAAVALPQAAFGQSMGGMQMPGMAMPAPKTAAKAPAPAHKKKHPAEKKRATQKSSPAPAHEYQPATAMPGMNMSADHPNHDAHDMSAMPEMQNMPGMESMAPHRAARIFPPETRCRRQSSTIAAPTVSTAPGPWPKRRSG